MKCLKAFDTNQAINIVNNVMLWPNRPAKGPRLSSISSRRLYNGLHITIFFFVVVGFGDWVGGIGRGD